MHNARLCFPCVSNPNVSYTADYITSRYLYEKNHVDLDGQKVIITPQKHEYTFRTKRKVPRVGVMLVGWGGNNGSTVTAAIHANKHNITWMRKEGRQTPNYFGSLTQATTIRIGSNQHGKEVHIPFKNILPMASPNDLVRQQRKHTACERKMRTERRARVLRLFVLCARALVVVVGRRLLCAADDLRAVNLPRLSSNASLA